MNSFLKAAGNAICSFGRNEQGAQVVEYALIIAVVSIVLVVALSRLTGVSFDGWIARVTTCLATPAACI